VRILIAIDSSRASQCVLEEAATRPWPANTLFTIVNVVDLYRFAHLPAIVDDARREAGSVSESVAIHAHCSVDVIRA
jgi:nucleotide-binding universal stress UspA family protein